MNIALYYTAIALLNSCKFNTEFILYNNDFNFKFKI